MFDSKNLRSIAILATLAALAVGWEKAPAYQGEGPKMEFVRIPAGSFQMGWPSSEEGREDDEGPVHEVRITKPFYMGKYEVTQGQWKAVMGTTVGQQRDRADMPWRLKGEGPEHPMYYVSWEDALEFCKRLGRKFRLPTEAEWEYACRAGTQTRFYYGDDPNCTQLDQYAWHSGNSDNKTHPVGQKKPNAWGLYDMHGNVWELCSDWFTLDGYKNTRSVDPTGPASATNSLPIVRGGSWFLPPDLCRSAFRVKAIESVRLDFVGFRVVYTGRMRGDKGVLKITLPAKAPAVATTSDKESERPPRAIGGVVRDEAGLPIGDVDMTLRPIGGWHWRPCAEGTFELCWSPRDPNTSRKGYRLLARHEQRNLAVFIEIEEDANALDVRLKPGVIVTGKVVDGNGKGIEGARVGITRLQTSDWSALYLSWLKTDAEGRFEFRALPPGYDYVFGARNVGYRSAQAEVRAEDVRDNRVNVAIVLARGEFSVSGVVVDVNDKPVANVEVYCTGKGQIGINSNTDANGRFKADGIFKGPVHIIASLRKPDKYGYASGFADTEAGATDVKIVLDQEWSALPKGRTCFPAGTDVWINGELVKISDAVPGRTVGKTDCTVAGAPFGQIEKLQEHEGSFECRDIVLDSGNRISVVDAHCFMLESGRWIAAQDLNGGLRLKTLTGTVGIKSVTIRAMPFVGKVYNLKVKGSDRYMVGEDGVIVRDY